MEIVMFLPRLLFQTVARGFDPEGKIEGTGDEVLCR